MAWMFHTASCRETGWGWDTPENSAVIALSGNKNLVWRRSPQRLIQIFRCIAVFAPLRRKFGCSLLTPARRKRNQQEEHMLLRNPRFFPIVGVPFLALIFRNTVGLDWLEPELLLSLLGDPHWLSMVSHGRGTTWRSGLQETEKDHRSAPRCMGEGEVLAGFFATFE